MGKENIYKVALNEKLVELGFDILDEGNNTSRLNLYDDRSNEITVQLIVSEPIDELLHGSHNGNETRAIGFFRFAIPSVGKEPEFFIFSFTNKSSRKIEFIIIPSAEIIRRLIKKFGLTNNQEIDIFFWLMPDSCLYEATQTGVEWEWYYMSKGINGRMADGTDWDYTEFLNHWAMLIKT